MNMASQIAAEPLDDNEWHHPATDERLNHLNGSLHAQGGSPTSSRNFSRNAVRPGRVPATVSSWAHRVRAATRAWADRTSGSSAAKEQPLSGVSVG